MDVPLFLGVLDGHTVFYPVFIMFAVAGGIAAGILIFSHLVGPRRSSPEKLDRYECGVTPQGKPDSPVSIKFFRIAILFILFDVEVLLLYPWAVAARQSADVAYFYVLVGLMAFVGILAAALVFVWKKGALEWD